MLKPHTYSKAESVRLPQKIAFTPAENATSEISLEIFITKWEVVWESVPPVLWFL